MWNMFKVNNKDTKTTERRHWRLSGIFIVNFEHISHHILVYLFLTWSKYLPAGSFLSIKLCFICGERQTIDLTLSVKTLSVKSDGFLVRWRKYLPTKIVTDKVFTDKVFDSGWFCLVLSGLAILDYFMIYTIYMIYFSNYIRTI